MEEFVNGDIVVINFPFSDLTDSKRRPALVLKSIVGEDFIFCQITSKSYEPREEVSIKNSDFSKGSLKQNSFVRFTKIFTGDESLISYKIGSLNQEKIKQIIGSLCDYLSK
jgi:mRNA interferase MazF